MLEQWRQLGVLPAAVMWASLAKILSERSVGVDMVSNGQIFLDDVARQTLDVGMRAIACSMDGLEEGHTYLRRMPGSW